MCIYRHHPLIEGMLLLLPEDPPWDEDGLQTWLRGLEANLRLLYVIAPAEPEPRWKVRAHVDGDFGDGIGRALGRLAEVAYPTKAEQDRARRIAEAAAADPNLEAQTDPAAAEAAAELEQQAYDLAKLEAEARQPGPPPYVPPASIPPEITAPRAARDRAAAAAVRRAGSTPSYDGELECPFPSPGALRHECAQVCNGTAGLRVHLSNGHHLSGAGKDVVERRNELIRIAVERAEHPIAVAPALVEVEVDEATQDVYVADLKEALDAGAVDVAADTNGAKRVVVAPTTIGGPPPLERYECPAETLLTHDPCPRHFGTEELLERHLQKDHRLDQPEDREELDDLLSEAAAARNRRLEAAAASQNGSQ